MEQNANKPHRHRVEFDLAGAAYGDRPLPPGYKVARHYVDPGSGFKGAAIIGPKGERHYVIAGTEDGRDALANINLGKKQYQSDAAEKMRIDAALHAEDGQKVSFTGHSLGGGLAQAMAYDVGKVSGQSEIVSSTSWNSFGGKELVERTREGDEKFDPALAAKLNSTNYRMADDKVSRIGTHIGEVKAMSGPDTVNGERVADLPISPARDFQSHGISAMARAIDDDGLDKAYPDKPVPMREANGASSVLGDAADWVHGSIFDPPLPIDEDQDPEASLQNTLDIPSRQPDPGKLPGSHQPPKTGIEVSPEDRDPESSFLNGLDAKEQNVTTDPRAAAIIEMARSPLTDPGEAALVKPVESWTESEMKDALNHAQTGFKGWRTGDPQKALAYERVQDWHTLMYGDGEQQFDGGKPVESNALVAIPKQTAPPRTIDGQDLYQASGDIGQKVAAAAGTEGLADAVKGLQRGLNMLGQQPMPARSPAWAPYTKQAPLAEDGAYGPKTDFALKQAIGRLGSAKVDDALALGRFNTFARQAQSTGSVDGLEQKTHAIFGPLFRAPNDAKAPKVEGGVFQETLNQIGGRRHDDWTPLKVDNSIGPKTTAAFGHLLQNEDADSITTAFGRGLGLL